MAAELPTTGVFHSRIGDIELEHGYPSTSSAARLYDEIDFQRACQAYVWALPIMAMQEWQREHRETFGAGSLDYVDYFTFTDKLGLLTANATTPYVMAFPDLHETGPLVMEVPAGPTAGGLTDFWQRPLSDSGQTGPDNGAGGRYLVLGPDHEDVEVEGYYVVRSPTRNVWFAHRSLDPDPEAARALAGQFSIYPYADRDKPVTTRHIAPAGRPWTGTQPRGLDYWAGLARIIEAEPVHERDRMMLAMLAPLGIEKGRSFAPDERQIAILLEAANVGELMARTIGYEKRFANARVWPSLQWEFSLSLQETSQELPHRTQLDERVSWFYEAVGVSIGMMGRVVGAGQVYLEASKDASGKWLDGGRSYRLHVPADVPVAQFWSVTVYDNETRCFVDTGVQPDRSSRDEIVVNADGSVDLFFGPALPQGAPGSNWIQTISGRGWFSYYRLYAPTQPFFDRSWSLEDFVEIGTD